MDECVVDDQRLFHPEGFAALDKALLYVERQAEARPGDLDMAARKRIDSYFIQKKL